MKKYIRNLYYTDAENKYGIDMPFHLHDVTPFHVTIKPTLACPARCDHCVARKKGFPAGSKTLDVAGWDRVFGELEAMGTQSICLSGGEPMVYKHIYSLAQKASQRGLRVSLNTSGWLFHKRENIQKLVDAGVLAIHLSIDSPKPEHHDNLRRKPGLHKRAVDSIDYILDCKKDMLIDVRMILHKYTFRDIPEMINLVASKGASSLSIDHIEHDKERRNFLLNAQEIREFREVVRPKILAKLTETPFENDALRNLSVRQINSLYSPKLACDDLYQAGIYWKNHDIKHHCTIPSSFMIIEGDGNVLPCNPIEYTRHPIMGNVHTTALSKMWRSDLWEEFRHNKFEYCTQCAMNQSVTLPFREQTTTVSPLYAGPK